MRITGNTNDSKIYTPFSRQSKNADIDPREFDQKAIGEGFIAFDVKLDTTSSDNDIMETQSNVAKLDSTANATSDERPGSSRIEKQKPYFRYIARLPDGTLKCYGGGLYLYSGWEDSANEASKLTTNTLVKGKLPAYFRAKNSFNGHNFSIQWRNVVRLYWKPAAVREEKLVLKSGNKVVTLSR